ncbi:hypothetical protein [Paenibacillus zanthoxyli]|uniref:hypothetical protein n=1 Tax=Paenibacillus zanthoxyli TaxID=369399 RepID=UPI0004715CFD|nr:hypothetical protein [Paenibacillus zanthoxyli]
MKKVTLLWVICVLIRLLFVDHSILKNNFTQIFDDLEEGFISYALIPSAYERITDFFWNNNFENNLNFIFSTPEYGIVCREGQLIDPSRTLKIACCSPVQNIIGSLSNGELKEHNVVKILTSSTTEALLYLLNGMADLAITNQTSFDLYKDQGIQFVYKKYSARIVWSLFKLKELLEVHY